MKRVFREEDGRGWTFLRTSFSKIKFALVIDSSSTHVVN
jgi:hypothetical protein